jgi:hypothetical protein
VVRQLAEGGLSDAWRRRLAATHGTNPAKISVARKLLICAWHMLSRDQVFTPPRPPNAAASSLCFQTA